MSSDMVSATALDALRARRDDAVEAWTGAYRTAHAALVDMQAVRLSDRPGRRRARAEYVVASAEYARAYIAAEDAAAEYVAALDRGTAPEAPTDPVEVEAVAALQLATVRMSEADHALTLAEVDADAARDLDDVEGRRRIRARHANAEAAYLAACAALVATYAEYADALDECLTDPEVATLHVHGEGE